MHEYLIEVARIQGMLAETTAKIQILKENFRKKPLKWSEEKMDSIAQDIIDVNSEMAILEEDI